jgi:hypothetical protein
MKYTIRVFINNEAQDDWYDETKPWLPEVGDRVLLITQAVPQTGIVRERLFIYGADHCVVHLICDEYND